MRGGTRIEPSRCGAVRHANERIPLTSTRWFWIGSGPALGSTVKARSHHLDGGALLDRDAYLTVDVGIQ